jgi:hypothetical protein
MSYVEVIKDVPEEVTVLTQKICTYVRMVSPKATVFVAGDLHVVITAGGKGGTVIYMYDFDTSSRPMASCMTDIHSVYTYASKGFEDKRLSIEVILQTLRLLPEIIQARLPGLKKAPE